MRKVFVEPVVLPEPRFRDGLGVRYVRTDGTDDPVEVLRPLWDVGKMQNAIRQRVSRLVSFRQARFVPVRAAEVPRDDATTIEVVSDFQSGHRLSQYLEASHDGAVSVETSTAIHILRELLGALALLHESRGVTHGAIGPERTLITPKGRVVVADYVLGPAIERLEFTRPRLWREFRIPLPAGKGLPRLDDKADVVQVGMTALALLLGRPIELAEYPDALDDLVATLNQAQRAAGRPPLPATLIGWVKRAVLKDPTGKFGTVSDARMALETVISKQDAASGGAAALRSLAEEFGKYAAAQEAKVAALAAEEARKAALAAQLAAVDAIRVAAADASDADPAADTVPAFTLLSEAPAASPGGAAEDAALEAAPAPVAESDPPVGWRVPEAPPVEETLPTSPLLQIERPAAAPPVEEFVEEVLDLTDLASSDNDDRVAATEVLMAAAAAPVEQEEEPPAVATTADGLVEVIVDLRELDLAEVPAKSVEPMPAPVESAHISLESVETQAVAAASEVPLQEHPIEAMAAVDAVLAALAALDAPAPEPRPQGLPEWRLLADPMGANAPTIDVEEPTESLDELVSEFAATEAIEEAPALVAQTPPPVTNEASIETEPPVVVVEAPIPVMAPPVAMMEARIPLMEAPAEFSVPVATQVPDGAALPEEAPSVLLEVLGLQEAQAAAQANAEVRPEPPAIEPDIAAWSFVEELMHHDARYEARPALDDTPKGPVAEDAPLRAPAKEADLVPADAADAPQDLRPALAVFAETADDAFLDAFAGGADAEPAPAAEEEAPAVEATVPALPTDWFIEVGRRPAVQAPVFTGCAGSAEALPAQAPAPPLEPRPPAFNETVPDRPVDLPLIARRTVMPEPEADLNGPVFPRVAPSVQRVRAEARRRRLARFSKSMGQGLHAVVSGCVSGAGAVAGGFAQVFSAASRGTVAGVRVVLAGLLFAATALSRGISGVTRAAAAGATAVVRGAASAGTAAARAAGTVSGAAVKGSLTGLRALASALMASAGLASKAAIVLMRAGGGAVSAAARGLTAGACALGRAGSTAAVGTARWIAAASAGVGRVAGRAAGRAASAATSAGDVAGLGSAQTGDGTGHAVVTVLRRLYFAISDFADHLPKPVFRPWYLGAALVVIVAVAGVPYAKAWWLTPKPAMGTIRIESARPDAMVTIDGESQGRAPLTASVPAGRHRIEIATAGQTRTHEVEVAAARETLVQAAGPGLKSLGSIRVTTDPAGVEVLVDGVLHGRSPMTIDNLTEGTHTVVVRNESGSVRRIVRVRADEAVDAALQIRPGWLAVFAPVKLAILENGRSIGSTEGGRILSSPGPHTIEVVSQAMGFRETRQVDINPGEVVAVTIQMPPAKIEIVAPADAEILVDGQPVGQAPLGPLQVAVGTREIVMRHPTLGERRQVISVTYNAPARVVFE